MSRIVLGHDAQRDVFSQLFQDPAQRFLAPGQIVRQDQMSDNQAPLHVAVIPNKEVCPNLPAHFLDGCSRDLRISKNVGIPPSVLGPAVLQVREINVDDPVEQTEYLNGLECICIIDEG